MKSWKKTLIEDSEKIDGLDQMNLDEIALKLGVNLNEEEPIITFKRKHFYAFSSIVLVLVICVSALATYFIVDANSNNIGEYVYEKYKNEMSKHCSTIKENEIYKYERNKKYTLYIFEGIKYGEHTSTKKYFSIIEKNTDAELYINITSGTFFKTLTYIDSGAQLINEAGEISGVVEMEITYSAETQLLTFVL